MCENGYDSNGGCGLYFDCIDEEGEQMFNEAKHKVAIQFAKSNTDEEINAVHTETEENEDTEEHEDTVEAYTANQHIPIEASIVKKFKVDELR